MLYADVFHPNCVLHALDVMQFRRILNGRADKVLVFFFLPLLTEYRRLIKTKQDVVQAEFMAKIAIYESDLNLT